MSSTPMLTRLRSPPEIPLLPSFPMMLSAMWESPRSSTSSVTRLSFSVCGVDCGRRSLAANMTVSRTVRFHRHMSSCFRGRRCMRREAEGGVRGRSDTNTSMQKEACWTSLQQSSTSHEASHRELKTTAAAEGGTQAHGFSRYGYGLRSLMRNPTRKTRPSMKAFFWYAWYVA